LASGQIDRTQTSASNAPSRWRDHYKPQSFGSLNKLASIWLFVPAGDPLTAADANGRHKYGVRQAIHAETI
jgi:hypothetical protein